MNENNNYEKNKEFNYKLVGFSMLGLIITLLILYFIQETEIDADGFIDISTHINNSSSFGWCNDFKGFMQYRYLIENGLSI